MTTRLTLVLTFFNFVGINAARILLSLYALTLGASPTAVGLLGGLFYVFPLLLSYPIGALADRRGPRALLFVGSSCGLAALLLPFFVRQIPAFYVAAALCGLSLAFNHVTLQNLIGILSKPEDRARNFSNFSLMGALTNFFGPLLAGLSIDHFGHAVASLCVASVSLVPLGVLIVWGKTLPGPRPQAAEGPATTLKTLTDRAVLRMLATSGLVQLGTDLFQFYLPIYGHAKGLSATAIGSVLACFASAAFIVRFRLANLVKKVEAEKLLAYSFYMGAAGFALVPFFDHVAMLGAIAFLFGLGMGIGTPLSVILMFGRSAEGRSGQTLGLRLTTNNFVRVTAPVLFGTIATAFGLAPVFWISAALMGSGGWLSQAATGSSKNDA